MGINFKGAVSGGISGGIAGGPYGALAGAAIGGLSDSASGLQKDSQSFTKEQWKNKHQWEVSDLKKAGLNPILSAHGGGVGGSPIASSSAQGPAAVTTALNAKLISAQTAKLTQETRESENRANISQIEGDLNKWALSMGKQLLDLTPEDIQRFYGAMFGNSAKKSSKQRSFDHGKPPWIRDDEDKKKYPATERARKNRDRLLKRGPSNTRRPINRKFSP